MSFWGGTYKTQGLQSRFYLRYYSVVAGVDRVYGFSCITTPGMDIIEKAYKLYLIAHGQSNNPETECTLESLNVAIALDSEFSLAWAMKVILHNVLLI